MNVDALIDDVLAAQSRADARQVVENIAQAAKREAAVRLRRHSKVLQGLDPDASLEFLDAADLVLKETG